MLKVLEFFAGIGAYSKALENLGIDFEVVDAIEIDKYAIKSYNAIHNTSFGPQDITKWDKDLKDIDLLCHSSPCQDYSLGGYNKGGDKGSNTRSSLMWETVRIIEKIKPKYIVWENVSNVLSDKHRHNFIKYIEDLLDLGYNSYYKVLNAKNCGVPQQRERIFVVSIRRDIDNHNFKMPNETYEYTNLQDYIDTDIKEKYYYTEKQIKSTMCSSYSSNRKKILGNDICGTLCARDGQDPKCIMIDKNSQFVPFEWNFYKRNQDKYKVRRLTPLEYWRLMGFNDEDYNRCKDIGISNVQLYKQAGNSIVVDVLELIFRELFIKR